MNGAFQWLPERASEGASPIDSLFLFLVIVTAFFTVLIAGCILYFVVRYRRKSQGAVGATVPSMVWLEITWTVIPLLIAMVMFVWGAKLYVSMSRAPADATEIDILGKQWMWKVQHTSGRREIDELHVPLGRPIKLVMTSQDVIHSFFIPAFRIKQDVLPGRYSYEWFTATRVGEYHLFCSQYCGTEHSHMIGRVVVMEAADYDRWLEGAPSEPTPVAAGLKLFQNYACINCHGQRGPTLGGLYGSTVRLDDGRSVIADDNYLRESILDSQAKVVAGWGHIMPSFRGQLGEEQITDLIAYIKSLKAANVDRTAATNTAPATEGAPPGGATR